MGTGNSTIMSKQRIVPQIMPLFSIFAQVNEARLAPRKFRAIESISQSLWDSLLNLFFPQEIVKFLVKNLKQQTSFLDNSKELASYGLF